MQTLQRLFQHNDWANRRLLGVLAGIDGSAVGSEARGTVGSIEQTIKHLVGVEEVYLQRIRGQDLGTSGSQEEYFAHDLAWFRRRSAELGQDYMDVLAGAGEQFLDQPLTMPWIPVPLTVREGLIQVLTHSAQHRAQILSTLGERGQKVPDMDYVLMRMEEQAAGNDQVAKA